MDTEIRPPEPMIRAKVSRCGLKVRNTAGPVYLAIVYDDSSRFIQSAEVGIGNPYRLLDEAIADAAERRRREIRHGV